MVKSETTNLSFGYDDDAKNIMEKIVKAFGGWVDYNDCDNEAFVKFEKRFRISYYSKTYHNGGCL